MSTQQLAEFLLARIAEDEAVAESVVRRNRHGDITDWQPNPHPLETAVLPTGRVVASGPRILAECEAKRRIVDRCDGPRALYQDRKVLQALALPYADHPDYRPEWRP